MKTPDLKEFLSKFKFEEKFKGCFGVERERFLIDGQKKLSPRAEEFLKLIRDDAWTYELSACQVEDRTCPSRDLRDIFQNLASNTAAGEKTAKLIGLGLKSLEVASPDMPLDVYPDERYRKIVKNISPEKLLAASRVTGTHVHVGVSSIEEAIEVYNLLRLEIDRLIKMGDHSSGLRLELYKTMALNWEPPFYRNISDFYDVALKEGFLDNPRNCWHLIRISRHGTVECRVFGSTDLEEEIVEWVSAIKSIIGNGKFL